MNRLLIRHARLLDPARGLDTTGDLLVEGERIAAIGGDLSAATRDAEMVMAEGLCLAPGLVDLRVQLREPGARQSPSAITISASRVAAERSPPIPAMRSPSTSRSPVVSSPLAGSKSRAWRISRRFTAAPVEYRYG